MQKKLSTVLAERDTLAAIIGNARAEGQRKANTAQTYASENARLNADNIVLTREAHRARQCLADNQQMYDENSRALRLLREEHHTASTALSALRVVYASQSSEYDITRIARAKLEQELSKLSAAHTALIQAKKEMYEAYEEQVATLIGQRDANNAELEVSFAGG